MSDINEIIAALRERARKFVSLDTPQDQDLGDVAADIGAGFIPGVGTAQSARDLERARREGDGLGMGLAGLGLIPFVGGITKGASALSKGAKAADKTSAALRAYPQAEALETARKNAAKMLGLPETNTAIDRAKALGFDTPAYKTNAAYVDGVPIESFKSKGAPIPDYAGKDGGFAGFFSDSPSVSNRFAWQKDAASFPVLLNMNGAKRLDAAGKNANQFQFLKKADPKDFEDFKSGLSSKYGVVLGNTADEGTVFVPKSGTQVRSRFAAFDPARVNENDLLGGATPAMLATLAGGTAATAATVSALREKKKKGGQKSDDTQK